MLDPVNTEYCDRCLYIHKKKILTQDEMKFGVCLESIMQGDQERRLSDGF